MGGELIEFEKDKKAGKQMTLLQKLGKSACCGSTDSPPARQSLPPAPVAAARGEVPRSPRALAAASASEKDTVLGRLPGPALPGRKLPCIDGTFKNIKYEGDMDQFMDDMGVSW